MKRILTYALLLIWCALPAPAQDDQDSGGMLVRFLENTLSGDNRNIRVVGLEGALSARATISRIEVSDDEGVWLTVEGAVLDWNRLALIRGRFSVNELNADVISIARRPVPSQAVDLPSPEATPFAVPELPVAVEIGQLSVGRIELGEPVAGIAASLSVAGNLSLADGDLATTLEIDRLDKPGDTLDLTAGFNNETRLLGIDLALIETDGGLVATTLKIPDTPPVRLTVKGEGPLDDFAADIALATDGTDRLAGRVTLQGADVTDTTTPGAGTLIFTADLAGDVTPMLAEDYRAFFGTDTSLNVVGQRDADGQLDLNTLSLRSRALTLTGALSLDAGGAPRRVDLQGSIVPADGGAVVLPLTGARTSVGGLDLSARLDRSVSEDWQLDLTLDRLSRPDLTLDRLTTRVDGQFDPNALNQLSGAVDARLSGLAFSDEDLQTAVGSEITLTGAFDLPGDGTVRLSDVDLEGAGYTASVDVNIDGLDSGYELDGRAEVEAADLSRFSGLAGRPLGGALSARLAGRGAPLSGSFDIALDGLGQNLTAGIAQLDPLLTGDTRLQIDAARGGAGLEIRDFALDATALTARIRGAVRSRGTDLTISAALDDAGRVTPQVSGPVTLDGTLTQTGPDWTGDLNITGPDNSGVDLLAVVTPPPADAGDSGAMVFRADLRGNLSPLLPTEYRTFFGAQTTAALTGRRFGDGRLELDTLSARSNALSLDGAATLESDGLPRRLNLDASIAPQTGRSVVLPLPGPQTAIGEMRLSVRMDRDQSDRWELDISASDLARPELRFDSLTTRALGRFTGAGVTELTGSLNTQLAGLLMSDARLQSAIGPIVSLTGEFELPGDDTLLLDNVVLRGDGYQTVVNGRVDGLNRDFVLNGTAEVDADDLSRFSQLAGRPVGGAVSAQLTGSGAPLGDRFDAQLELQARDLSAGIEQVDALLRGETRLSVGAARRESEIEIRGLALDGTALTARADGTLRSGSTEMVFSAELDDLGRVVPQLPGRITMAGDLKQTDGNWKGNVRLDGARESFVDLEAVTTPEGATNVTFDARFAQLERLVPDFAGDLTATGKALRQDGVWRIFADATGPARISTKIGGTFTEATGETDLVANGSVALGAANAFIAPISVRGDASFDLAMRGKPGLEALSGTITTSGTTVAVPQAQNTINNLRGSVALSQGRANIDMAGNVRTGGGLRVSGPVALAPPFNANLVIDLQTIGLTDEVSYTSTVGGRLTLDGPLIGNGQLAGRINVGRTELNIAAPTSGVSSAPIPPITHVGESGGSRITRERAGLIETGQKQGDGPAIGLNVEISAPNQIFVRGRGLDAELGGNIVVRGTTRRVVPSGQIGLIRGRLDILGRRLNLSKGIVTLQGSLEPYLEFAATSDTDDGTATLEISGLLSDLEIEVYSEPPRPSEEALAILLFGDQFTNLSPLRIAQLAASLNRLRGGTGSGIGESARGLTGAATIDVGEDAEGNARAAVGGYVSENVYTDVAVNAKGDTELNINLDLTDNITVKGSVDNLGQSGIGVFFDKDY